MVVGPPASKTVLTQAGRRQIPRGCSTPSRPWRLPVLSSSPLQQKKEGACPWAAVVCSIADNSLDDHRDCTLSIGRGVLSPGDDFRENAFVSVHH